MTDNKMETITMPVTNENETPREMTMLEYVNSHFKGIQEAINDTRRLIAMLDKLSFKEMCKSEAIVAMLIEKCGIKEEDLIQKFQDIVKEYQKDVEEMKEKEQKSLDSQPKDVNNLTPEEASEIREKIKADVETSI